MYQPFDNGNGQNGPSGGMGLSGLIPESLPSDQIAPWSQLWNELSSFSRILWITLSCVVFPISIVFHAHNFWIVPFCFLPTGALVYFWRSRRHVLNVSGDALSRAYLFALIPGPILVVIVETLLFLAAAAILVGKEARILMEQIQGDPKSSPDLPSLSASLMFRVLLLVIVLSFVVAGLVEESFKYLSTNLWQE